jgi:hypothetical protein
MMEMSVLIALLKLPRPNPFCRVSQTLYHLSAGSPVAKARAPVVDRRNGEYIITLTFESEALMLPFVTYRAAAAM